MPPLGLLLIAGLGCTKAGKFAGTWLILGDGPLTYTDDCYDPDDATEEQSSLGTIEIFGGDDGEVVVYANNPLKGPADGNSFKVRYEYEEAENDSGGSTFVREEVSADLDGKVLSGTYRYAYGWGDWTCGSDFDFTATRIDERDTI